MQIKTISVNRLYMIVTARPHKHTWKMQNRTDFFSIAMKKKKHSSFLFGAAILYVSRGDVKEVMNLRGVGLTMQDMLFTSWLNSAKQSKLVTGRVVRVELACPVNISCMKALPTISVELHIFDS